MKKETIKYIIQLIVAILTAIGSTLSVTTAASGAPAEGVALLGGTIVGTGWLHHLSTLVSRPLPQPLPCREGRARQRWGPHTQFVGMGFIAHQQGT